MLEYLTTAFFLTLALSPVFLAHRERNVSKFKQRILTLEIAIYGFLLDQKSEYFEEIDINSKYVYQKCCFNFFLDLNDAYNKEVDIVASKLQEWLPDLGAIEIDTIVTNNNTYINISAENEKQKTNKKDKEEFNS